MTLYEPCSPDREETAFVRSVEPADHGDRALFQAEGETTFSVSVSDGQVRQFTLSDFCDEGEGLPSTGRFDVPESGVLTVEPKLEVDESLASEGSGDIGLREDFEWSVTIFKQVDDPAETCIGCMGTRRIPIDPEFSKEEDESLWVVWSGRAEGDDVVF